MTVLVSNNLANIAAASVATAVFILYLPAGQAATASTVVTSVFIILFGEIAPKSYAVAHAEQHALRVARPVTVAQCLLRPVLFFFEGATAVLNRLTGGDTQFESYLTREEIETIVKSGEEIGVLELDETPVWELFDRNEVDPVRAVGTNIAVVNGSATIMYVNGSLGLSIPTDGPYQTIAGLVNHHVGVSERKVTALSSGT